MVAGELHPREYRGQITLTQALAQSINTATVRLSEATGRERVRAVAQDFGMGGPIADGPALALGVSEATLLEMTGAYAGFLAQGVRVTPYGLTELRRKSDGAPLMRGGAGQRVRVIDERAAGELVWMMRQVVEGGTGARARAARRPPAAGKTGTTQAARDAWFVGFTADYVTGVWMGYDDNTPLTGTTRRRAAGGDLARDHGARRRGAADPAAARADPCPAGRGRPGGAGPGRRACRPRCAAWCENVLQGLFGRN